MPLVKNGGRGAERGAEEFLGAVRQQHETMSAHPDLFTSELVEAPPLGDDALHAIESARGYGLPPFLRALFSRVGGLVFHWVMRTEAAPRFGAHAPLYGHLHLFSPGESKKSLDRALAFHQRDPRLEALLPVLAWTDEACLAIDLASTKGALMEIPFDAEYAAESIAPSLESYLSAWRKEAFEGDGPSPDEVPEGLDAVRALIRTGRLKEKPLKRRHSESERSVVVGRFDLRKAFERAMDGGRVGEAEATLLQLGPHDRALNGTTPLMLAAQHGNRELIARALALGMDANDAARNGWTALHFAAASGKRAAVDALVEAGAEIDPADRSGRTPLFEAADLETAERLIEAGADPERKDTSGKTAQDALVVRKIHVTRH